ncbi:MAG TPA: hypothetical protein DC039_02720 [Leclercia adecarboxylata]|nr:hypothetical protein EXN74_20300 [Leclercia adecarboxylata]QFH48887.1 hypothetical protein FR819_06230 [Leclercia adecarboxylata]HBD79555.1 hypothetical protein [Leclercia adecarboxylata]
MRIDPCSVNTFFNENVWNVTVWLGCEQRDRIFGNYWLLIVFVQRNARQKKRPRRTSWRRLLLIYKQTGGHPRHDLTDRSWF